MATKTINERMPIAKVRDDLDAVIDHAQETKQPIVVTRDGKAVVVIIDAVQYQQEMEERELYRGLVRGLTSKKTYTLEEVEAGLDALLHEE
ncbi:MAG: type II toxin-antitoxin system prevent-host-death family antitoxin [Thermomicrobiales bacterium]